MAFRRRTLELSRGLFKLARPQGTLYPSTIICQQKQQQSSDSAVPVRREGFMKRIFHFAENFQPHTDAHSKVLTDKDTLYEMQFHYVKPECMDEYIEAVGEMVVRLDQSDRFSGNVIGSWTTQYGDLDQAIHLWIYKGGYNTVSQAKRFLATDKEFLEFAKGRSKMLRRRHNQLLHDFNFWGEPQKREPSHIYELRSYSLKPGTLIEWSNNWGRAIKIRQRDAVGGFFSQIGELYQVHHLWAYDDLETRKGNREIMWQEPGWGDCVANTVPLVNRMESRILVPTPFSPMQ